MPPSPLPASASRPTCRRALVSDPADVNGDHSVDVADIATIIDIMAGKGDDDPMGKASEGIEP